MLPLENTVRQIPLIIPKKNMKNCYMSNIGAHECFMTRLFPRKLFLLPAVLYHVDYK